MPDASRFELLRSPNRDRLLGPAVGLVVLVVYVLGACPTIYVGDSGDLATAAHTLGIAHPSGYPLYLMLGKLWTVALPFGSIAFRLSLFSAFCAAATIGLFFVMSRGLGIDRLASAWAALLVAFGPSFWSQATIQRVYSLNALFTVAATAVALRWWRSRKPSDLAIAFFLCGLGATNHTFMAVYAFALALFAAITEWSLARNPRAWWACGAGFSLGLLPYSYLPVRSRSDPVVDWGNPETFSAFLGVVLREGFWERRFIEGPGDIPVILGDYLRGLASELFWIGAAAALIGLFWGRRQRWPIALPLLVMAVNLAVLALHGSRSDIFIWHRYYIPSYLMAGLLAGMGCHALARTSSSTRRVVAPALMAVPLAALVLGWRDSDRSRYRIAEDFSRKLLDTLPPGASLTASDDNILFVLTYLHFVEGVRPDIHLIRLGVDEELPPLTFNPDRDPLFFTHHPNWRVEELEMAPMGLVFQTVRSGRPFPALASAAASLRELDGENDPRVPKDYLTRNLIGHFHYMLGVTFESRDWRRASRELETAKIRAPENDVLFYNLGLIYERNGLYEEALDAFQRAQRINPRGIASRQNVRAADRIAELERELERLRPMERSLAAAASASGLSPGSAAFHRFMGQALAARGERRAAAGHRSRAQER